MIRQNTYWHLEPLARAPDDYEIATSRLLYYPERGFEVRTPLSAWYERHQRGSPLRSRDWEQFRDPRGTTYAKYIDMHAAEELRGDDRPSTSAPVAWLELASSLLGPLRYPVHALGMVASYIGQMAPSGRITVAALFQAADEVRRVERLIARVRQIREVHPALGGDARARWQDDPRWQPMRETVERLLVTYDWGEALVALNVVVKPMFDSLFVAHLGALARQAGDIASADMLDSLWGDCLWHRDWTSALLKSLAGEPRSLDAVDGWIDRWAPRAIRAGEPFGDILCTNDDYLEYTALRFER